MAPFVIEPEKQRCGHQTAGALISSQSWSLPSSAIQPPLIHSTLTCTMHLLLPNLLKVSAPYSIYSKSMSHHYSSAPGEDETSVHMPLITAPRVQFLSTCGPAKLKKNYHSQTYPAYNAGTTEGHPWDNSYRFLIRIRRKGKIKKESLVHSSSDFHLSKLQQ